MNKSSKLLIWISVLVIIVLTGVAGFILIENYNFLDALYMTVITIATIGYREVKPLSSAGKIFNIVYIISSFAVFTYALSQLTRFIVSGEMASYLKNRKLMQAIKHFHGHVIICGFGRHGQQAAYILKKHASEFVAIDTNEANFKEWKEEHGDLVYVHADATDDEVLKKAGLMQARALILTLPADADNVFIVLSARSINPHVQIISRAAQKTTVNKLKTAGADYVISPDKIGGAHMAALISRPDIVEFIDNLWDDEADSINLEAIDYEQLPDNMKEKTLAAVTTTELTGLNCIAVKNRDGKYLINPPAETVITKGMKIILLGTKQQIENAKKYIARS